MRMITHASFRSFIHTHSECHDMQLRCLDTLACIMLNLDLSTVARVLLISLHTITLLPMHSLSFDAMDAMQALRS